MKHLILKPRNCGWSQYVVGVGRLKALYGLVDLPWWMRPEGAPITDPRRLLTAGEPQYYIVAKGPSVEVTETWAPPTPAFPMGSYRLVVGGKTMTATGEFAQDGVPGSPYWHGGPPFVVYSEFASWPEGWKGGSTNE